LSYLESLPDSSTAGPIFDPMATNALQIIAALPKSVRFSLHNPVVAMTIKTHQKQAIEPLLGLGFKYDATNGLFLLDLHEKTLESIWGKGFSKHDRQAVKYYEPKAGFGFAGSERDYLALKKPESSYHKGRIFRADFISRMRAILGERFEIALLTDSNGTALAGFMMVLDPLNCPNPSVHLLGIRHSATRNIHSAVTFINWKAVNWAHDHGFRYVDFGLYPRARSSDPAHAFYKLRKRFEITSVPRYQFILPTSNVAYSIAKGIKRIIL
jgi:hypothetical protein